MKKLIDIPVSKKEDVEAVAKRMENYAIKRDLQAIEFNEAIIKRSAAEALNVTRCEKCGKEIPAGKDSANKNACPDCS